MFNTPDARRIRVGRLRSTSADGNNGAFLITRPIKIGPISKRLVRFTCIATDQGGWEHVSVSLPDRCPTWEEMAWIKSRFWDPDDAVIQIHPPESDYVNNHPYCLHLWRKAGTNAYCEWPPSWMVGIDNKSLAFVQTVDNPGRPLHLGG
jgi:hypothetical protein